jgi:hypothetical protein
VRCNYVICNYVICKYVIFRGMQAEEYFE